MVFVFVMLSVVVVVLVDSTTGVVVSEMIMVGVY